MRRKTKRATQEEIQAFENSMHRKADDADGSCSQGDPCLCNFAWLDDTALSALPYDSLLRTAAQYRDIITGLLEDRKELTGAFRTVLERNNVLITDEFGKKSEKLSVLLGVSQSDGRQPRDEDIDDGEERSAVGENPVKSFDRDADKVKDKQEEPEACTDTSGSGSEDGHGQDGDGEKEKKKEKKARTWKPVRSKGCLEKQCRKLPTIQKVIEMTEEELEEIFGKGNYRRLEGNDKEIIEYEYVPRTLYVRKTVLCAYEAVNKEADNVKKEMTVARNPVMRLRQHSRSTSSIWSLVLSQRYCLRLPWKRVASDMERDGLALTTQMMEENARFFYGILAALIQRMWYWLFLTGHIQIDETPVLMYDQRENILRQCYFWVFTVSELYDTDKPVTIFIYAAGKDTGVLRRYLVEDHTYTGYATTDGHNPYHIIEEETDGAVRNTGCLNHFRTKLARVLKAIPGLKQMTEDQLKQIPAFNVLSSLQLVFRKEKETKGMTAGERTEFRKKYVFPELEEAFAVLEGLEADDYGQGSLMHKALTYRDNQKDYLKRFIEDGSIPLTNSNSERRIAFFALLRNVSHFFGSDIMGKVGAGWETLAQTARAFTDHVDDYFQYLLDEAVPFIRGEDSRKAVRHTAESRIDELEKNALAYFNDERLDRFMPWSVEYHAYEERRLRERRETAYLLASTHENRR
ncbi:MAG: transposase [Lachnospiraceae bacterium]|nr:transposase [Eubacterium sp.]MBR3186727.1 transposase [Lachnospiraceae bacterium]